MQAILQRVVLYVMIFVLAFTPALSAFAQAGQPPAGQPGGITWQVCDNPPTCFASREARQQWAQQNNCRFLEDVCEKPPSEGGWGKGDYGKLSDISRFVDGLVSGLKGQLGDLWDMITNPMEVLQGIWQLAESLVSDPKGTVAMIAELLGQEAVDAMTKATMCGPYDLGKVIGTYVSPALALKVATRMTKFGGKLDDVIKALKRERGCASFAAGTTVWTPEGMVPIERISQGQHVLSRHEASFVDQPQEVLQTFGRIAPSYRVLTTEAGTYKVTDEHPLWVQGKGWTEASQVVVDDVIASAQGDTLVMGNEAVRQPLRVYNFSVANTPSYFVGTAGLWAHNAAACRIGVLDDPWKNITPLERGMRGEWEVAERLIGAGYKPVGNTQKFIGRNAQDVYQEWVGQRGIDGIYKNEKGEFVIIESKAKNGAKPEDLDGCVDRLCKVKDGERQLSDKWIRDRVDTMFDDPNEREAFLKALDRNKVTKIYAQTDELGTSFHKVKDRVNGKGEIDITDVEIEGGTWEP